MRDYLFNFGTIRNPQKIPTEERTRFHVHLDDEDRLLTNYWRGSLSDTFEGIISDIRRFAVSFEGAPSLHEIDATHGLLIALYREVKSEARRASLEGLPAFVEDLNIAPLTRSERVVLWDSFAHYLWIDPQEEEISLISAVLVADKLLEGLRVVLADSPTLTAEDEATLRRISLARVVLPLSINNRVRQFARPRLSAKQRQLLGDAHDQLVASENLLNLERDRDEIFEAATRTRVTRRETTRRIERDRETRLREGLTGRVSAGLIDTLLPELTTRLEDDETGSTRPEDVVAEIALPRARRLLTRFSRGQRSINAVMTSIVAHIGTQRNALGRGIFTAHTNSFIAFGAEITIEEKIPPGTMIVKASRADEGGFHYYLSYFHDQKKSPLGVVSGTITAMGVLTSIQATLLEQTHLGFQTFRLTEDPVHGNFADFSLTLVTAAITNTPITLEPFRVFDAIPHFEVPDFDQLDDIGLQPPPLFGINRLGVIDYRRVEQELACYVTGEVSRIENILASEFKERVSRSLSVVESEEEITQEISSEYQTDTETAEKLEMNSEVSSVLREEVTKNFDASAGVVGEYSGVTLTANASFNYNSLSAREDSTTEALEFAQTVTNRVQEKLVRKATSRRRSLARREYEDINKHGFDNRLSNDHVVGVYRWVDKIYNNHLVNYGKLNVIEFEVPEPAKNFIRAQENTLSEEEFTISRPPPPLEILLVGPHIISRSNYTDFAAAYGIDVSPPPVDKISISRAFSDSTPQVGDEGGNVTERKARATAYNEINVPDGYVAQKAWVNGDSSFPKVDSDDFLEGIKVGGGSTQVLVADQTIPNTGKKEIDLPDIEDIVPVGVITNADAFVVTVTIECTVRAEVFRAWQHSTYNKLIEAYRGLKADYDAAREDHEAEQEKLDLNPRFKRQHMERELKRVCIEMMTKPFNLTITADHYAPAQEGEFHPLVLSSALDRHSRIVRFFEQAFDWTLMSYIFYPYFYADPKIWSVKVSMEATSNPLFSAFLSAGMGRVMLPIRRGFGEAVTYYLQTGQVWFGAGFVLDVKNDLYLSIADEMLTATEEAVIEKTWQTKLPTNHTILQSAASALIAEGLPCEIEENKIGVGESGLAPVLPPTGPAPG